MMLLIAEFLGYRAAIVAAGGLGLAVAGTLATAGWLDRYMSGRAAAAAHKQIPARQLLTPAVLGLVGFFALLSLSTGALNNYSVVALQQVYGVTLSAASLALSAFLFMSAIGVIAGGFVADRTTRHGEVAAAGYGGAAACVLLVGTVALPPIALVAAMGAAGFLSGMISPSRDMLVRAASPPGAFGRVFGIVTTGFNIGGTVGPVIGGWIMDHELPQWIFYMSVILMLVTALAGLLSDTMARRRAIA
jgi:predicted MFS family arabinose efflux permease